MTELPESFNNLKNLRYLYFHETGLIKLPNFIALLPKLRYIGLQGIKLNNIPEWVKIKARKYHSRKYIKEGVNKGSSSSMKSVPKCLCFFFAKSRGTDSLTGL